MARKDARYMPCGLIGMGIHDAKGQVRSLIIWIFQGRGVLFYTMDIVSHAILPVEYTIISHIPIFHRNPSIRTVIYRKIGQTKSESIPRQV